MRRAANEMTEEDEFGMNKTGSVESDPMEIEATTAVKDHPDFTFLSKETLRELASRSHDDAQSASWLQDLPVEKDATQWTFLQVQIRPDRAWLIMQELIATICIGHGMMLAEETQTRVLFRKKVGQDSMAHGMLDAATYQNLVVAIGVLPSKLRVLHIGYLVSNEQKLFLGGVKTSHFHSVSQDRMKALMRAMDSLLAALQSTLTSQFLTASYLYMTTPENTATTEQQNAAGDEVALDDGYIGDVRRMFLREMKANMRELCIPLEEYAHTQEYECALLLGLLDPLLKKYGIDASSASLGNDGDGQEAASATHGSEETSVATTTTAAPSLVNSDAVADANDGATGKLYGEAITDLVHELWTKHKRQCENTVQQKIEEKKNQVTARVQSVQKLRMRALEAIINHPSAAVTTLKPSNVGYRDDVVLYDGSCVVNNVPVKLHVTYGYVIYRTMVPIFARTTIIPFQDVVHVTQSTTLGIRVVHLELNGNNHIKGLTIAMGLEIDLLYQLLLEILEMQKRERERALLRRGSSSRSGHSASNSQFDGSDLETLIGAEEDEEKAGEENDDDDDEAEEVTLRHVVETEEQASM